MQTQSTTPSACSGSGELPDEQMLFAIRDSVARSAPFEHLYMREVFSPGFYARLLAMMPARDRFHDLRHKDAMRADGSSARLRMYLYPEQLWRLPAEQRAMWTAVSRTLRSGALQEAFKRKFRRSLEGRFGRSIDRLDFYPIPILLRDQPGYRIGIHADVPAKAITVQFYLPRDGAQRHLVEPLAVAQRVRAER